MDDVTWSRCCASSRRTAPHCVLTDGLTVQVTLCCYYGCRDLESVLRCIKKNGASLEHLELSRSSLLRMDPLLFRNVLTSATRQIFIQFKPVLWNRNRRNRNFLSYQNRNAFRFCSGSSSGTEFGPGSNIKCNTKSKNPKLEANFLGNNASSSTEKARFCPNFCC
jgi:hypothetical protein